MKDLAGYALVLASDNQDFVIFLNLRFQAATGQLESHGRLGAVRKEIARIYTIIRERELGIASLTEQTMMSPMPA